MHKTEQNVLQNRLYQFINKIQQAIKHNTALQKKNIKLFIKQDIAITNTEIPQQDNSNH